MIAEKSIFNDYQVLVAGLAVAKICEYVKPEMALSLDLFHACHFIRY